MMRAAYWRTCVLSLLCVGVVGCGNSSQSPATASNKNSTSAQSATAANDSKTEGPVLASGNGSGSEVTTNEAPAQLPPVKVKAQPVSVTTEVGGKGPSLNGSAAASNSPAENSLSDNEADEEDDDEFSQGMKDLAQGDSPELAPKEGTAEWHLRELMKLQLTALPEDLKPEELRTQQIDRQKKIVALARKVVAQTHSDKEKVRVFDVAVHRMIEAQVGLALLGDAEGVDGIYDSAKSLYQRDPKSKVASDAGFALVNLAFTNAHNTAAKDDRWVKEYAKQARSFAGRFPEDQRGSRMLFNAALGCEWNNLPSEAAKTYALLEKLFPKSEQGQMVPAIQKRLQLQGESVALSGPSLTDGKTISLKPHAGKVIAVVFWSAGADVTSQAFPGLVKLQKQHESSLAIVGVCVDDDAEAVKSFVKEMKLTWPTIFFTEKEKMGWNNPIVKTYGVLDQSAWIIEADGTVRNTCVSLNSLEPQLSSLLKHDARREK